MQGTWVCFAEWQRPCWRRRVLGRKIAAARATIHRCSACCSSSEARFHAAGKKLEVRHTTGRRCDPSLTRKHWVSTNGTVTKIDEAVQNRSQSPIHANH